MCGIVGIADSRFSASELNRRTERMADAIVHRGPDDQGHLSVAGMAIGMRRLSIIDLTGGMQPIANETADVHVVCNGEIYNFIELRDNLVRLGHHFSTGSDTEVIVHLYEEYGVRCLDHLRGMFALAIMDQRRGGRILIARDRMGKKPLFYACGNGRLLFASEMKSLLAVDPSLSRPNYRELGAYFQLGYIHQPATIYRDIYRLPAGHFGHWEAGELAIDSYWKLSFDTDESLTEGEWQEKLDQALADSVRVRLRSDVPLGVFLSGGLDSSAVVAYASQAGLKPLQTFTIGFDRPEWDESQDALLVARHFETDHHCLRLSESEMLNSLETTLCKIVQHCDEPFGDASALPMYHVSRLAREHVTVVLSGDGGDELFAGYSNYQGMMFAEYYRRYVPYLLGRYALPSGLHAVSRLLRGSWRYRGLRYSKVLHDSALPLDQAYRDKVSIWRAEELKQLFHSDFVHEVDYLGDQFLPEPLEAIMSLPGRDLISRLTERDIHSYLLDDILVKVDRMSMAHSLEVRSPLLDHHVVELAARMPTRFKFRPGRGKHILREVLRSKLPKASMRKGKQGFCVPLRDWFRASLSDMVYDYLGPGGYLPDELFQRSKIASVLHEHRVGTHDHSRKIWLLMVFAAWHRSYQVGTRLGRDANAHEVTQCAS